MHHIVNHEFDYILILSGDQLYQMDFKAMLKAHIDKKAEISIATIPVNASDATEFGILKTDEESFITSFIEKPKSDLLPDWTSETSDEMKGAGRNYLASMGIYIFNRDLLIKMLNDNPEEKDFGKEIIPRSLLSNHVLSYQYEGYWTDIGNISSFFEANLGLTDELPHFNMFDNAHTIFTRARMLPPSKVSGTTLEKTIVSEGCIIQASRVERAVLGIRSRIGKGTTIANTYVMGSDHYQTLKEIQDATNAGQPLLGIGDRCYINNAIVDKNCRIGNDVRINGGTHLTEGDYGLYVVKDGIVVVKKGATIPNGTVI
jgi:glucose-1-phosphate adenylyltransferase